jgi:hypothetical protein
MRALKRDENVHDAIQLAVQKSTRASLALITSGENSTLTDEVIHDLRKRVQVVRSLLRLVRVDMGGRQFRRANRCLREANFPLSGVRDARVVLTSCNRLIGRCDASETARKRLEDWIAHLRQIGGCLCESSAQRLENVAGQLIPLRINPDRVMREQQRTLATWSPHPKPSIRGSMR